MRTSASRAIACAIVKNEPRLAETIANVRGVFGDALAGVLIHDTGSSPPEYAPTADRRRVRPFDDFASARNACLDDAEEVAIAHGAEWLFMFSGGAEISGSWHVAETSRAPALCHTERLGAATYAKCCTVRVGSGLRFAGKTHEVIVGAPDVNELPHCGLTVDYSADWNPEKKRARWLLDLDLLADDYSPRGRYYYAQTLDCLGMNDEAFCAYARRLEMRGYLPEKRQAAANAVRVAPTLALASWAATVEPSAEAWLALAERCKREQLDAAVRSFALAAQNDCFAGVRSLFARTDIHARCKELLSQ